jgi:signal recognition particle receptor subunit beta
MSPQQRGDIMSLATKDDRTLFFDFMPIELGNVKGFKTRFHLYTVPGQVYYALTRRAVLTSVDGVVFVADSQESKIEENIESLNDLDENLKFHQKSLETVPFVIQYNKRDMGSIMAVSDIEAVLNKYNVPAYEASALNGDGVMETLTACCKLVLKSLNKPASAKYEKPKAAAGPDVPEVEAEPEIKLSEEEPAAEPVSPAEPISIDSEKSDDSIKPDLDSSVPSMEEPLKTESTPLTFGAGGWDVARDDDIPEVEIDTSYFAADNELSIVPDSELSSEDSSFSNGSAIADAEIPSATIFTPESNLTVISCGDPQKISDTCIKVPLKFRLEGEGKEGSLNIKINFEDFKLS